MRHGLQHGKIETTTLTIGDIGICSKRRTGEQEKQSRKSRTLRPAPLMP
jgi:hypothetical protein